MSASVPNRFSSTESLLAHRIASRPTESLLDREAAITQSGGEPPRAAQQTWHTVRRRAPASRPTNMAHSQAASPREPPNKHGTQSGGEPPRAAQQTWHTVRRRAPASRPTNMAHSQAASPREPPNKHGTQSGGEPPRAAQQTWHTVRRRAPASRPTNMAHSQAASPREPPNKHGTQSGGEPPRAAQKTWPLRSRGIWREEMRVAVGTDHAGFELKNELIVRMRKAGHEVIDVGAFDADPLRLPPTRRQL